MEDRTERDARARQAEWVAAAKPGFAAEAARLEEHGPTLARYRRCRPLLPED
ncbi:hypothetical protein [Roseivivax sp. CAU 1753]